MGPEGLIYVRTDFWENCEKGFLLDFRSFAVSERILKYQSLFQKTNLKDVSKHVSF